MRKREVAVATHAGVDVGSKELVVKLLRRGGDTHTLVIPNTPEGHHTLLRALTKKPGRARVVLEATGTYHLDLALTLSHARGVELMVVNPLACRRFAQAQMRRAKTDKVDASVLLEFCQRMPFEAWTPPGDAILRLRAITRHLASQVTDRVALENRLLSARATASTPEFVLADLADQIAAMATRIHATEAAAVALAQADPELAAKLTSLTSIPGIAERAGVQLLGELAPLDPAMSPDEVVAHAGLDPRPKQSGVVNSPRHISKIGNARLRGALYMPALTAARWDPAVRAWHESLLTRKKHAFLAITAVMRRLLRVAWVLVTTRGSWDSARFSPRSSPRLRTEDGPMNLAVVP